jgi:hypothetical protein
MVVEMDAYRACCMATSARATFRRLTVEPELR